jgi:predicted PurR-regulated permease PerM
MSKVTKIEFSTWSLLKVVGVALVLWFLYLIRGIIAILFVAIILASAVDPTIDWLVRRKIPRFFGVLIIYIILLSLVSLVIVLLLPPATHQIQNLAVDFPNYWQKLTSGISAIENYSQSYGITSAVQNGLQQLEATLSHSGAGVFDTLIDIFGGVISFLVILVITFYLLLEENATKKVLRFMTPARYQPYITRLLFKMRDKIGLWLRGQIVLSLIIGLIVFIGLSIFGYFIPLFAKYALVLALLAFLFEFIPYLGPMLAAVPALFIGFTQGWQVGVAVLAFYVVMQWCENNLIVPQVMKRAVGLNPIIVIVALMVGFRVAGIIGMALAIPVTTALSVVIEEVFRELDQRDLAGAEFGDEN